VSGAAGDAKSCNGPFYLSDGSRSGFERSSDGKPQWFLPGAANGHDDVIRWEGNKWIVKCNGHHRFYGPDEGGNNKGLVPSKDGYSARWSGQGLSTVTCSDKIENFESEAIGTYCGPKSIYSEATSENTDQCKARCAMTPSCKYALLGSGMGAIGTLGDNGRNCHIMTTCDLVKNRDGPARMFRKTDGPRKYYVAKQRNMDCNQVCSAEGKACDGDLGKQMWGLANVKAIMAKRNKNLLGHDGNVIGDRDSDFHLRDNRHSRVNLYPGFWSHYGPNKGYVWYSSKPERQATFTCGGTWDHLTRICPCK
jgi:hypothetical protein